MHEYVLDEYMCTSKSYAGGNTLNDVVLCRIYLHEPLEKRKKLQIEKKSEQSRSDYKAQGNTRKSMSPSIGQCQLPTITSSNDFLAPPVVSAMWNLPSINSLVEPFKDAETYFDYDSYCDGGGAFPS